MGKEVRKQVIDVKAVRGAEIGSDHYLVLMKIKLKAKRVKKNRQEEGRQQIKLNKLKEEKIRREYQAVIAEMYEEARGTDIEVAWKELKDGIVGAAMMVCGCTRRRKGEAKRTRWWNEEVKRVVRKKKVLYRRLLDTGNEEARQLYKEARLEAKRMVRRAKNEEWVQLGKELENDAKGNQQRFWARLNESRRTKESMARINDKNGQVLSEETEVIGRWREHFEGLFQEAVPPYQAMQHSEATPEDDLEIMKEEVRRGVKRLKMGKAPGICGIVPEMLKAGGEVVVDWMAKVFNMVWREGEAPRDWKNAVIVPVYKKGIKLDCTNYRGISLMSVVGKVFARVLNERVKGLTVDKVMDEQGGFRAGRGCNGQIFAVKHIVEKTIEKDKKTCMAFVDLEKAYDSVSREKLWKVLDEYGVKGKLLRAIQALYVDGRARVKVGRMESELFSVYRGVRQGCTLSPWLFNVFMDRVTREAKRLFRSEVKLSTGDVGVLLFADDMVVMAESAEGLQHNLQVMSDVLSKWELKVNWRKTKVMSVARKSEECEVKIGEEVIDQVEEMKYLGVMISSDGRMEKEVEARIGSATRVIGGMNEAVLKRKELSRSTKLTVVNATMMPTLVYGCETWCLSKQQQSRVQATQMNVLRRIEGVSRLDRVRNVDIREKLHQASVLDMVKTRQEKWKARMEEMSSERTTKKIFEGEMAGKRPRGRPRMRWTDNFK